MRKGYVYFITDGEAFKIGFSKNPSLRLCHLQISHHFELHMIATFAADQAAERQIHKRFKHLHIRGEWYWIDKEITDYIDELSETNSCIEQSEHKAVLDLNRFAKRRRKNKERLTAQAMTQDDAADSTKSIS